ncbi:MAG TPA: PDR/VanB family oxidoreductase [Steroidobacteraceae bacterium]|nr:PDR/VanB family oxidoreductase [Steroidobacteraceae bacterium]
MNEWLSVRISRKQTEAADIVSFKLVSADGSALPPFTAGSHIDVEVRPDLVRQYSLCNASGDDHYLIAVLKEPSSRGGSSGMHELAEGAVIRISAPRNQFPLVATAAKSLLFAGGIGITPLFSMAETLSLAHSPFILHYCAQSPERMAFMQYLQQASYRDNVFMHFDNGAFTQRLAPERVLATVESGTHIYACGPAGFIDWIVATARYAGWPDAQIHLEYFSAQTSPDADAMQSFEVQVASTGAVFIVEPGQSITDVLRANGMYVPTSCEQGICGTCLTTVIDGIPDHRDNFLTEDERNSNTLIMPCCSRAKSHRLVLDL